MVLMQHTRPVLQLALFHLAFEVEPSPKLLLYVRPFRVEVVTYARSDYLHGLERFIAQLLIYSLLVRSEEAVSCLLLRF